MRLSFVAAKVGVVGVAVLAATTVSGRAQTEYWPQVERELKAGLFTAPVSGAPFAAEAVTTWTPPADSGIAVHRVTTWMYRASDGRARVEHSFADGRQQAPREAYVLVDPAVGEAWRIDLPARAASRSSVGFAQMKTPSLARLVLPVSDRCAISVLRPQTMQLYRDGTYAEEDLGQRQLAGVSAVGRRFTATIQWPTTRPAREMTDERWVSRDLRLVLHSRSADPEIGVVDHVVTRLRLGEPPPQLFAVPADAAPGEPGWPFSWENPHALTTWRKGIAPCTPPSH